MPFYLTPRDRQIVTAVYTHRALTSDQVSLLFWGSQKAHTRSRHRLRLLAEHGYLERAEQAVTLAEGRRPLVYFLAKGGVPLVAEELGAEPQTITWKPSYNRLSWPFLEHLLATNDIRVRFEWSAPQRGLAIIDWHDDFSLGATARQNHLAAYPDGYVALADSATNTVHRAFIEADRGTVPVTRFGEKVKQYLTYFTTPHYRDHYQATKPCRVLTVTTSPERMGHLKAAAEEAGGATWFWFTTFAAIADPSRLLLAPSWQMAGSTDPVSFPYPSSRPGALNATN